MGKSEKPPVLRRKVRAERSDDGGRQRSVPLELCDIPPEVEALRHYAESLDSEEATERLSLITF